MLKLQFIICLLVHVVANNVSSGDDVAQEFRPIVQLKENITLNKNLRSNSRLHITNDGPTIFGSRTVFTVKFVAKLEGLVSYQWGTYFPYNWKVIYSNSSFQDLDVSWWRSIGSKTCFFIVNQFEAKSKKWKLIGKDSSTVDVQDRLQVNISYYQDNQDERSGNIFLGSSMFLAQIHDPSKYLQSSVVNYSWIFDDGSSKLTTRNFSVKHTFRDVGLFFVQLSVSVSKNGRLLSGDASLYVNVKAKLTGSIIVWKNDVHNPTLPSQEENLPWGPVGFLFKLHDPFKFFAYSNLSFIWNFGDGIKRNGTSHIVHNYTKTGQEHISLLVNGYVNGEEYSTVFFKNISIREPIKDLNVKGHLKPKEGDSVKFHVTCKGSAPVSFCWYVTRGNCELANETICSPTKLYHNCWKEINHTFHRAGDYCMNITVTNTVSFAQKSFRVSVSQSDYPSNEHKKSYTVLAAILPIVACMLLLVMVYLGIKSKIRFQVRKLTRSETATFDFRKDGIPSGKQNCVNASPSHVKDSCPSLFDCSRYCPNDDDNDEEQEMQERKQFFNQAQSINSKANISYYGTIQRTLGQEPVLNVYPDLKGDDLSPWTPRKNWSKSV